VIFQSAKLGDIPQILCELDRAEALLHEDVKVGRVYGISGGALVALAFGLALAAQRDPVRWGKARSAPTDLAAFLRHAHSRDIRAFNLDPLYGPFNLDPLRRWVCKRLRAYAGRDDIALSALGVPLYLCAMDGDGTFTLIGPADASLQFQYHWAHIGPPRDARVVDALVAAVSTMLSTEPTLVTTETHPDGEWFRDCRPAIVDAGALVADLEASAPRPILRTQPYTPIRSWKLNWITSPFIMHSKSERNHVLLTAHYLDLLDRHSALEGAHRELCTAAARAGIPTYDPPPDSLPRLGHIDLPYVGSTEASTNMRQTVEHKDALTERFERLLAGQPEDFSFDRPANVIYGAGGASGILAGLVATRAVNAKFERGGGTIRQIYGVSAGVINGFFHAVQIAAAHHPDLYTPAAQNALTDLENFLAHIEPKRIVRANLNPARFCQGWTNLGPLEAFLLDRLRAYTGSAHPAQIAFDDIALPLTITVSRADGFIDLLGMAGPDRHMRFGGHSWSVRSVPIARAIVAGWSMNTYIEPTRLGDQIYVDGGGTFYDPALFVACLDPHMTNLLNIHVDDPESHSYNLPPRLNLVGVVFETHNYIFPEERRRMRLLSDRLYAHYQLRARHAALLNRIPHHIAAAHPLPPDFRREWHINHRYL
jgi:predicted acylesterase/phospholipase RssA